jgi:hypothetical protein
MIALTLCHRPHLPRPARWTPSVLVFSAVTRFQHDRASRVVPSPAPAKDNKAEERWLLCRPHGGLTDTLTQMWNCFDYAKRYGRRLVFDGYRSGLLDDLSNYFSWAGDHSNAFLSLDSPALSHLNRLDCEIPSIKGRLEKYAVLVGKKMVPCIGEKLVRYESVAGVPLTFCFERDYPDELLVHEQSSSVVGGGPKVAAMMLCELCLTPRLVARCNAALDCLPDVFTAIHVRNTDYQTDYQPYLDELSSTVDGDVLICSDDLRVREYAKMAFGKDRTFTVTDIPNTEGKRLHSNPALDVKDLFEHNASAFVDLIALASASKLYFTEVTRGKASGFSRLANILNKDPALVAGLLGRV